tara:strand:- start:352 stop:570 length:219 start_codon:yes stop_codon:yes gene_type:complete
MSFKKPYKECYNDITHKIKTIENKLTEMRLKIEEIKTNLQQNENFEVASDIENVQTDISDLLMFTTQGEINE